MMMMLMGTMAEFECTFYMKSVITNVLLCLHIDRFSHSVLTINKLDGTQLSRNSEQKLDVDDKKNELTISNQFSIKWNGDVVHFFSLSEFK